MTLKWEKWFRRGLEDRADPDGGEELSNFVISVLDGVALVLLLVDLAFVSGQAQGSYKVRVCLPDSAVSIFFKRFPTRSGSILSFYLFALAILIMVDLVPRNCLYGGLPASVLQFGQAIEHGAPVSALIDGPAGEKPRMPKRWVRI